MFGYVLPLHGRLSEEEKKYYKAAYCGLCRSLKVNYGFRSRFLVNYDMTFLYCLLQRTPEETMERCSCPARPFCKRDCVPNDSVMTYVADLTVLLSWWKLQDGVGDGGLFRKFLCKTALWLYGKPYRKASKRHEDINDSFRSRLKQLRELEEAKCSSMDRVADTFATLLGDCVPEDLPQEEQRILKFLLYHVGRYLYLVDALEDLPKDQERENYNPLAYRYQLKDGKLSQEDKDSLINSIEASIDLAASALELLSERPNRSVLENIIYDGLSAVLKSVSNGSFRKRRSKNEGSV